MRVDVAIVGTGPGGAAAAWHFSSSGIKIALLEKGHLPRPKACGGMVPDFAFDGLPAGVKQAVLDKVSVFRYLYNFKNQVIRQLHGGAAAVVERSRFDIILVKEALRKSRGSIQLLEGFTVASVEQTDSGAILRGKNGNRIRADFVIAADGAAGLIARGIGLRGKDEGHGYAISAEVELDCRIMESFKKEGRFNFFCLPKGYGWIFPKGGSFSCGIGSLDPRQNLMLEVRKFLANMFGEKYFRVVKQKAGRVPVYRGQTRFAAGRVFLVGDAANLVDPITGEGIRYALESGKAAAEEIEKIFSGGERGKEGGNRSNRACRCYERRIRESIVRHLKPMYLFGLPVFLHGPDLFYRRFICADPGYGGVCRRLQALLGPPADAPGQ